MMEEDGVMIFCGYFASVLALGYFVEMGRLAARHLAEWLQMLMRLLERAG